MNRIKQLRSETQMKQIDLAQRLKVRQTTISNWETGKTEPDTASLQKMSKIFDTTIDYILGNGNERIPQNVAGVARIPVLGSIPAGIPLEAIEDIVDWKRSPKPCAPAGRNILP